MPGTFIMCLLQFPAFHGITLILQVTKLRHREVKQPAKDHTRINRTKIQISLTVENKLLFFFFNNPYICLGEKSRK